VATLKPFDSIGEPHAGGFAEVSSRPARGLSSRKPSHLLKRLERAVNGPKSRRVGKRVPDEPIAVQTKIDRADLEALEGLRSIARRGCHANSTRLPIAKSSTSRVSWRGAGDENNAESSAPSMARAGMGGE